MKWFLIAIAGLTVALATVGIYAEKSGQSEDEKSGSAFFYLAALGLGSIDIFILIIWAIIKAFSK